MKALKLTNAEIQHLKCLISSNVWDGSYFGNKVHWNKRSVSLLEKLGEIEDAKPNAAKRGPVGVARE